MKRKIPPIYSVGINALRKADVAARLNLVAAPMMSVSESVADVDRKMALAKALMLQKHHIRHFFNEAHHIFSKLHLWPMSFALKQQN